MTVKKIFLMGMLLLLAFGLAFAGGGTDRSNDSNIYGTQDEADGSETLIFHSGERLELVFVAAVHRKGHSQLGTVGLSLFWNNNWEDYVGTYTP